MHWQMIYSHKARRKFSMSLNTLKAAQRPTIWLARKAQQGRLIGALEQRGFSVLDFSPLVAIPRAARDVEALLREQPLISGAIFISPSAVEIFHQQIPQGLSSNCRCYGPGARTAAALAGHSYNCVESPSERYNSEALLALTSLQEVAGEHFVIVAGDNGRPLIEETLKARGASVATLRCYHRSPVSDWSAAIASEFSYAVFSSGEAYRAAAAALGEQLSKATVVVTSQRLEADILREGFRGELLVCADPSPDALANLILAAETEAN
jgi:uroporphyrinogen-III synthase